MAQCSRAWVNVARGAAPKNEVYTMRRTPAATAASTKARCSTIRSGDSVPDTMNTVSTPSSAAREAAASA